MAEILSVYERHAEMNDACYQWVGKDVRYSMVTAEGHLKIKATVAPLRSGAESRLCEPATGS